MIASKSARLQGNPRDVVGTSPTAHYMAPVRARAPRYSKEAVDDDVVGRQVFDVVLDIVVTNSTPPTFVALQR